MTTTMRAGEGGKVPAVTLGFWIVKILATTLGETAGDTVTMSMGLGYLAGSAIFVAVLVVLIGCQVAATRFRPALYWATIVASTTAGTTMADFATRSLGIGYAGGSALLLAAVLGALWMTITLSQTLGTALGDWTADDGGLGYAGAALLFSALLAGLALLYWRRAVSAVPLFWAAFILTRPLGAAVGDFLDKPVAQGGLSFSRPLASTVLAVAIVLLIAILPQRAGGHPARADHRKL